MTPIKTMKTKIDFTDTSLEFSPPSVLRGRAREGVQV